MQYPDWLKEFFFGKRYRLLKHLLFWVFIYADEILSFFGLTAPLEAPLWHYLVEVPLDMLMVYFNIYFLLPRLFLKGRIVAYLFFTLLIATIVSAASFYVFGCEDCDLITFLVSGLFVNSGLTFIAVAMKLFEEFYNSSVVIKDLEADKLKTELAYLKNQVNPHFLFNTLNNMYVMAQGNSPKLPDTIMQLSDLLRYQLYDTESETVSLKNEVEYLENYLNLEKIRREDLRVDFKITGDINKHQIRPLLLLPFVENAFKFSNSGTGSDFIDMHLNGFEENIEFTVKNNKGSLHQLNQGGIGLTNARRRLELAYPDRHALSIKDEDDTFAVSVNIKTV